MSDSGNVVFDTYSDQADTYDGTGNVRSCWGLDTERIIKSMHRKPEHKTVVDVGCGTGGALLHLATGASADVRFVGVEPAENMRRRAETLLAHVPNAAFYEGAWESIPLDDGSVDYMISINSFHWSSDLPKAVSEAQRVLAPKGDMDHFFIGRLIGREFVKVTSPIFLRYMGPKRLLEAASMRQHLTRQEAENIFRDAFSDYDVEVTESFDTYFDTVEGHLGWWVRIEPQLLGIPEGKREACIAEVKEALASLATEQGVPYTKHTLHAAVRGR
jgi:ubiquinone/menaquinone biosynthesis C-methylase UbiE